MPGLVLKPRPEIMTFQEYNKKPARYPFSAWLVTGLILFFGNNVQGGVNGQRPEFNTTQPYLIYYGNWTAGQVDYARINYHLVILHPASNITSNQVAAIRGGKDNIAGKQAAQMVFN
jgi:hypothetical protein